MVCVCVWCAVRTHFACITWIRRTIITSHNNVEAQPYFTRIQTHGIYYVLNGISALCLETVMHTKLTQNKSVSHFFPFIFIFALFWPYRSRAVAWLILFYPRANFQAFQQPTAQHKCLWVFIVFITSTELAHSLETRITIQLAERFNAKIYRTNYLIIHLVNIFC